MSYYRSTAASELKVKAVTALITLSLAFGAVAIDRYESPAVQSRRPAAAAVLRARSRRSCPEDDAPGAEVKHDARFDQVMQETKTVALETLVKNGTTVCLDTRIDKQNVGLFDRTIRGAYYPEENIVSLLDDGSHTGSLGLLRIDATTNGNEMLEKLAGKIEDGELAKDQVSYAGKYSCGKNCTTIRWKLAGDFDQDTQAKNPHLAHPPGTQVERPEARF